MSEANTTSDSTDDFTGPGDDWLQESLVDATSNGTKPVPLATRSELAVDDSSSWERAVIGEDELDLDQHRDPSFAAITAPPKAPIAQPTKPATTPGLTQGQSGSKPDNNPDKKPDNKAKKRNNKPGNKPVNAKSSQVVPDRRLTWGEKRKLRRADKRLAEREAKALMYRRPLWRGRVVPKTVLGISFTMLVSGLAMAASGTLLYMNYRFRQDQSDALVRNFPQQVRQAQRAVQNEGRNARAQIHDDLEPIRSFAATSETLTVVQRGAEPSVWGLKTFDVDGQPTAGTAFVVASDDQKTLMLTSLSVVSAATVKPGPKLLLRKGAKEVEATLWTWDEAHDLALLVVPDMGDQPPLSWSAPNAVKLGDQLFEVSGYGTNNASIAEGRIADAPSADGLQHDAPVGVHFRGGPLLDPQGRVVAVASRVYAPYGFVSDGVFFAPPVQAACDKVLKCLNNRVEGAGVQR